MTMGEATSEGDFGTLNNQGGRWGAYPPLETLARFERKERNKFRRRNNHIIGARSRTTAQLSRGRRAGETQSRVRRVKRGRVEVEYFRQRMYVYFNGVSRRRTTLNKHFLSLSKHVITGGFRGCMTKSGNEMSNNQSLEQSMCRLDRVRSKRPRLFKRLIVANEIPARRVIVSPLNSVVRHHFTAMVCVNDDVVHHCGRGRSHIMRGSVRGPSFCLVFGLERETSLATPLGRDPKGNTKV